MEKLDRLNRLYALVESAGGHVDGRKKLHKLAYICQHVGTDLGQTFMFHMYGVYSPSLAEDLAAATRWNVLAETNQGGDSFEIGVGSERPDGQTIALLVSEPGFAKVRELAKQPPAMLEVLTTILYLWNTGYRGDRLAEKLRELKGHLGSYFPTAFKLANEHFGVR